VEIMLILKVFVYAIEGWLYMNKNCILKP